jgi:hypothetical protein
VTTTNLRTARRWRDLPTPIAATICIFALLAIAALMGKIHNAPSVAAQPTPSLPIVVIATQAPAIVQPTAAPVVQVAAALPRFVVCYDQPINGAVLGPIPAPDTSAIVARYGVAWVMTPWNGGYCWLRAADVGLPDVADLQAPAPAQPQVIYEVISQPAEAVPTPTESYQIASEPSAPVWAPPPAVINPADFVAPDPKASCAFVGCLR